MNEDKVRKIEGEHNHDQQLLGSMCELIPSQISSLQRSSEELSAVQYEELKRIKTADARPIFRKKSNKEQFKSATEVLESLEDTKDSIEMLNIEKAKESLDKGISLVKEMQKLIQLADQSKFVWKTVNEYKNHELEDDSDDEKKI